MNVCREHSFKEGMVQGFELGYAPVGKPLMNVFFYLVEGTLFDTGQSNMRKTFVRLMQDKEINLVLLTHHHEDHSGNASIIKEMKKVTVYGHPLTAEKLKKGYKILPYQKYTWGKADIVEVDCLPPQIESENFCFTPVHSPGHSKDHTVFLEKNQGWLFSGDFFLGTRIKYFRADESMKDTIESLRKVLKYDFDTLFCGLNPQEKNGKKMLAKKLDYLENLYGKIAELFHKGYDEKTILKLTGEETTLIKVFTFGNVGRIHMIRSAIRDIKATAPAS